MLTAEQKKYLDKLILKNFNELKEKYEVIPNNKGLGILENILNTITTVKSPDELNEILGFYPDDEVEIESLVKLQFAGTAFDVLEKDEEGKRLFAESNSNEIAVYVEQRLQDGYAVLGLKKREQEFSNEMQENTKRVEARTKALVEKIEKNKLTIEELTARQQKQQKKIDKNRQSIDEKQKKMKIASGIITPEDREQWIKNMKDGDQFKDQIVDLQKKITSYNSILKIGGKDKSLKIQTALNNAIDAAMQAEARGQTNLKNIDEFKAYKKKPSPSFSSFKEDEPLSINEALATQRFERMDKFLGRNTKK